MTERDEFIGLLKKWLEVHGEDRELGFRVACLGPVIITGSEGSVIADYDGGDDLHVLWSELDGVLASHWRDYLPMFRQALLLESLADV